MSMNDQKRLVKKKWRLNSEDGPLVLAAEHLVKRMHQHRYSCHYEVTPLGVTFFPDRSRPDSTKYFADVLSLAVRIINADLRVSIRLFTGEDGPTIRFDGVHEINARGVLVRKGKLSDLAKAKQPIR